MDIDKDYLYKVACLAKEAMDNDPLNGGDNPYPSFAKNFKASAPGYAAVGALGGLLGTGMGGASGKVMALGALAGAVAGPVLGGLASGQAHIGTKPTDNRDQFEAKATRNIRATEVPVSAALVAPVGAALGAIGGSYAGNAYGAYRASKDVLQHEGLVRVGKDALTSSGKGAVLGAIGGGLALGALGAYGAYKNRAPQLAALHADQRDAVRDKLNDNIPDGDLDQDDFKAKHASFFSKYTK